MNELYCRAVAVATFQGNSSAVDITHLVSFNDSFNEISDGSLDVVAGESMFSLRDQWSPDLSSWYPDWSGKFKYSEPYYFMRLDEKNIGKEISLVTLSDDDDPLFASFVNSVVMATLYAVARGITQSESEQMPTIEWYGHEFDWMLRDVIHFIGDYDDIYKKSHNVTSLDQVDRWVNYVPTLTDWVSWEIAMAHSASDG